MSSHIRMRCSICGKQYQIERKLFCYYAADQIFFLMQLRHIWNNTNASDRYDSAGRWCSSSVSVAQGLQTGCLLGCGSGSECDSDILTHAERKTNARERKPSITER